MYIPTDVKIVAQRRAGSVSDSDKNFVFTHERSLQTQEEIQWIDPFVRCLAFLAGFKHTACRLQT